MRRLQNCLILILLSFTLVSCGGDSASETSATLTASSGGGASGGTGVSTPSETSEKTNISVSLVVESEIPFTINADQPGKLVATVTGASEPVVVTFSSEVGQLPITAAVTVDGKASVDIIAGSKFGTGVVTATLSDGTSASNTIIVDVLKLSMGSGTPFVEQAQLSIAQISSGGTASVSVDIVDEQGVLYLQPIEVSFSSDCVSRSAAKLDGPVFTNTGRATSTYTAQGCVNDDVITVTADVGGANLVAQATINILPAAANSIKFVSATPEFIGIIGTGAVGGSENSALIFKVVDINDQPVVNTEVNFSLNTNVGGLELSQSSAKTDGMGLVKTVVHGGSVATTVRVTAQISDTVPLIATQSSSLIVSTGIPDQDSFSLSSKILNPEGWEHDDARVNIMARLSDTFNNPVPDGTAVTFRTEGGQIESGCLTVGGGCSVVWISQEPRPNNGRSTITVTALGEESFPDTNGNGRFDEVDFTLFDAHFDITADTFEDFNEDGIFNPLQPIVEPSGAFEKLIDFNFDGILNGKDHKYNGVLCGLASDGINPNPNCANGSDAEPKSAMIRKNLVLIMSGSTAVANLLTGDTVTIIGSGIGTMRVNIADINNQQMPIGTKVTFTTSAGSIVTGGSFVWPSSNAEGGREFVVNIKGTTTPQKGLISVTIETPLGNVTEIDLADIEILPQP